MNTRAIMTLGLSALVLGGSMVGCTMNRSHAGLASAGDRAAGHADKAAARQADRAERALAKGQAEAAVGFAEAAVGMMPQVAEYRGLLGRSYLNAGRFVAARDALTDALTLAPDNGEIALHLALAQTAAGDWGTARATLERHAAAIPASDRGLAMALAGDPAGAVQLLTAAARQSDATPKTRQNLALALALAGQWPLARAVAATDMSPADVDKRMTEWAAFAQPAAASDQVAALLGTVAVEDAGQPVALALNAPAAHGVAIADAAAIPHADPAEAAPPVRSAAAPANGGVVFLPRSEVVQALPVRVPALAAPAALAKAAPGARAAALAAPARGNWHVQLGAYDSPGVARDAWARAQRRFAALSSHAPLGMNFAARGSSFYRLSVGGFSRADADRLCRGLRAQGGACFVRLGAGDQVAAWARQPTGVMLASRS